MLIAFLASPAPGASPAVRIAGGNGHGWDTEGRDGKAKGQHLLRKVAHRPRRRALEVPLLPYQGRYQETGHTQPSRLRASAPRDGGLRRSEGSSTTRPAGRSSPSASPPTTCLCPRSSSATSGRSSQAQAPHRPPPQTIDNVLNRFPGTSVWQGWTKSQATQSYRCKRHSSRTVSTTTRSQRTAASSSRQCSMRRTAESSIGPPSRAACDRPSGRRESQMRSKQGAVSGSFWLSTLCRTPKSRWRFGLGSRVGYAERRCAALGGETSTWIHICQESGSLFASARARQW